MFWDLPISVSLLPTGTSWVNLSAAFHPGLRLSFGKPSLLPISPSILTWSSWAPLPIQKGTECIKQAPCFPLTFAERPGGGGRRWVGSPGPRAAFPSLPPPTETSLGGRSLSAGSSLPKGATLAAKELSRRQCWRLASERASGRATERSGAQSELGQRPGGRRQRLLLETGTK